MSEALDLQIDTACTVSEEFTKLYYDALDNKRHTLSRFYMDNATMSWDGNPAIGKDTIQAFLQALPSTTHTLTILDAQPVSIEAVKGQQTVLIQAHGHLKTAKDRAPIAFSQSFVVTAQDNKWKIFSDCCRLLLPLSSESKSAN